MNEPVLLVEDRDDDVFFMRRAWKVQGVRHPLQVARDGREAVAYLVGSEPFSDREKFPFPCLVLLDLKLPYMMGTEVLRWIRSQPQLRTLPVIMLTSSEIQRDIDEAYRLGANAFLVKPSNVAQIEGLVAVIRNFWLGANRFPSAQIEALPVVVRAQTVFQ
jgi:CheY-like chemotaxis protein